MILILLSFFSFPLEGSVDMFLGYYPTMDTSLNVDASMWGRAYLIRIKGDLDFFAQYSSYLEMAEQQENVVFDPAFAIYSIKLGFQYTKNFYFSLYLDHWCRHFIDRDLEEGKATFNSLNFNFSNIREPTRRFSEDFYFSTYYIFYPQEIFVDWFNSKPYYRHRVILDAGKRINSYSQVSIGLEYTVSNDNPRRTYYFLCPGIDFFKQKSNRTFYAFIKFYLKAKGPFRSPEQKLFFGIGYSFNSHCK
jgi:hypothetical protein